MGVLNRIVMRIWLPFSGVLLVCLLSVAWYYPQRQAELFRKATDDRVKEVARAIALSVELSLEHDAFDGVSRALGLITNADDFDHVALVHRQMNSKDTVFSTNPVGVDPDRVLQYHPEDLVVARHPVVSEFFLGYVQVAVSKQRIQREISAMNRPVYQGLFILAFISLFMLLAVARSIARPLVRLRAAANMLRDGDYSSPVTVPPAATEVNELSMSLESLRTTLEESRDRNQRFNEQLEEQIQLRTIDLERTQGVLLEAQRVALLGNFEYAPLADRIMGSDMFMRIIGMDAAGEVGLDRLRSHLGEKAFLQLRELLDQVILNGERTQLDIPVLEDGTDGKRWLSFTVVPQSSSATDGASLLGIVQDVTRRKRIEEEVGLLSMVARRTSNSVVITDVHRRITWVNDALLRLTGYEWDEVMGRSPAMFQFEGTDPLVKEEIRRSLTELKEINTEVLNRGKHGKEYWLQLNILPLYGDAGEHVGFMAVETDITERMQAAQELERSRNMFRVLVENLQGATYHMQIREEQHMLFMSQQVERIIGLPVRDFVERRADRYTRIHPDDSDRVRAYMQEVIASRRAYDMEYRILVEGELRWLRERGNVYPDASALMLTATITDITGEVLAEEAIKHGSELLTALAGATTALLSEPNVLDAVAKALPLFGRVLGLDRICLFQHVTDGTGAVVGSGPVLTWMRDTDGTSQLMRQELSPAPRSAFGPLLDRLLEGSPFEARVQDVAHRQLAAYMASQGVRQVLALPIQSKVGPWGFLCLDHMREVASWESGDRRTIDTYISALSTSLERDQRIAQLEAMTRFPDGDPNPVMRIADDGTLLYANRSSEPLRKSMGLEVGRKVPDHLHQRLTDKGAEHREPVHVEAGDQLFNVLCIPVEDFGFYNLYGTDVTAMHQLRLMQEDIIQRERMSVLGRLTASIAHEVNNPLGAVLGASRNMAALLDDSFLEGLSGLSAPDIELLVRLSALPMQAPDHLQLRERVGAVRARLKALGVGNERLMWSDRIAEMGWGQLPGEPWEALLGHPSGAVMLNMLHAMFEVRESLRIIDYAAERAAKVVKALRTYIHQDEDRKPKEFDLASQLRSITTLFKASGRKGLVIDVQLPEVIHLNGVEDDLAQVWSNILSNAMQAIGDSGTITVRHHEEPHLCVVEITNDGPMIPPDVQARMFDPLFTTKKKGEGTGIGLDLVRRILDAHRGSIRCDSDPERTRFTIQLPRQ